MGLLVAGGTFLLIFGLVVAAGSKGGKFDNKRPAPGWLIPSGLVIAAAGLVLILVYVAS